VRTRSLQRLRVELPEPRAGRCWFRVVDTSLSSPDDIAEDGGGRALFKATYELAAGGRYPGAYPSRVWCPASPAGTSVGWLKAARNRRERRAVMATDDTMHPARLLPGGDAGQLHPRRVCSPIRLERSSSDRLLRKTRVRASQGRWLDDTLESLRQRRSSDISREGKARLDHRQTRRCPT
jgi:hypothetical protein